MTWQRALRASVPYWLILPVLVAIAAILGYPLYKLVMLSFQQYGLAELIQHKRRVGRPRRTTRLSSTTRSSGTRCSARSSSRSRTSGSRSGSARCSHCCSSASARRSGSCSRPGLVLVWSMPVVVAVQVWYWMTNFQNGILNYALTRLHLGDYFQHDWYATTFSKLAMVTLLIVWGALPFVTITVYAGLVTGVARARRGGRDRRRRAAARLPRRHVPDPEADLPDPHEPLDHLGLRRLHAAVPADRRLARRRVELPDGRLRLHRGLRALELRPRRGDLDADAASWSRR